MTAAGPGMAYANPQDQYIREPGPKAPSFRVLSETWKKRFPHAVGLSKDTLKRTAAREKWKGLRRRYWDEVETRRQEMSAAIDAEKVSKLRELSSGTVTSALMVARQIVGHVARRRFPKNGVTLEGQHDADRDLKKIVQAVAIVQACNEILERHHGMVVKQVADEVTVRFTVPSWSGLSLPPAKTNGHNGTNGAS
jgi:hypothetical protein